MELLKPDAALEIILRSVSAVEPERVDLRECLGRVLAEDATADGDLPPFDNTAMDGYAVIAEDTRGATRENPIRLSVVGEQPAGKSDAGPVTHGSAVRIMTGAPIPAGADAIVIVEHTQTDGGDVLVYREASPGANVRRAGEDVKRGQVVLTKGSVISPAAMGMLASVGVAEPLVYRKPRAAVITTGDELVDAAEQPAPGQIRNGNQYSLLGEALHAGCEVTMLQRTRDDQDEIERTLALAAEAADLVIVCGGVSVGDYDYVKDIIDRLGQVRFWKVAIKPGKPFTFGDIGGKPVFGLPGNPVSCLVCFDILVRPAIRRMAGDVSDGLPRVRGIITEDLRRRPDRREYIRAVTSYVDGVYKVSPIPKHGSGMLSSMVDANSYVVVAEGIEEIRQGEEVDVVLFRV